MADYALYPGAWSGEQVDEAVGRALSGGELDREIAAIRAAVGSPLVANTAAAMTDTTKVYVYTGTEAGYTAGHWYYWNGSAWADGGVYNAVAVDDELSDSSVNAVQNKVITAALADLEATAASKLDADGTAQQAAALTTDQGYTDTAPYTYRRAGAGHAGTRMRNKSIVGGTVAWNQLVNSGTTDVTIPSGRKYVSYISGAWSIGQSAGTAITVAGSGGDMLFDLTLALGSSIADKAFALESATAGSGIAWLRSYGLFPAGKSYAYDAGSLESVCVSAHKTVGFNQWDEEWEVGTIRDADGANIAYGNAIRAKNLIPVIPGASYFFKVPAGFDASGANSKLYFYDADRKYLSVAGAAGRNVSTMSSRVHYIRFALDNISSYGHDVCINFSDPAKNGEYEPYEAHTYPIDPVELRGILKLDGDNIVADGDVYPPSGEGTRRYGIVDLGTLTWSQYTAWSSDHTFRAALANADRNNCRCDKYACTASTDGLLSGAFIGAGTRAQYVYVSDTALVGKTAEEVKAALDGVMFLYELATPTTETAAPYAEIEVTDKDGTEAWTDAKVADGTRDVAVPVGGERLYMRDLVGVVEDIPEAPSADGSYRLAVTVSGGVASYAWVSA